MLVKYVGVPDQMTCDYNGKRYVFSKLNPICDIPIEVFRLVMKDSNGILSEQVIPYEKPVENKEIIVKLETEEPRRPGRPKNVGRK